MLYIELKTHNKKDNTNNQNTQKNTEKKRESNTERIKRDLKQTEGKRGQENWEVFPRASRVRGTSEVKFSRSSCEGD